MHLPKILVSIFFIFITVFAIDLNAQTNAMELKIKTLETKYTSGTGANRKGKVIVTYMAPGNVATTLQIKEINSSTWLNIGPKTGSGSSNFEELTQEVVDLRVRDIIYCVQIIASDAKGLQSTSKQLCTIPFKLNPVLSDEGKPTLDIASYQPSIAGAFRPKVNINCISVIGGCKNDFEDFTTQTQTTSPYYVQKLVNTVIKCGETKILQIVLDYDNSQIISDTLQFIGQSKEIPSTITNSWAYATVVDDKVVLNWKNDNVKNDKYVAEREFILERKEGNGIFVKLDTGNELKRAFGNTKFEWSWTDATSKPTEHSYTYKLSYFDFCDSKSPDTFISPIHLTQDISYDLLWTNQNNNMVYEYYLEYYDIINDRPRKEYTFSNSTNRINPPEISNYYRIRAQRNVGEGVIIYSNFLENAEVLKVLNPTVFTPDNHGPDENNTFKVKVRGYYTFLINIYNRNGLLMYSSDNYDLHQIEGWNGKYRDSDLDAPEGVYAFEVRVTNKNRNSLTKRGSFVLVRN